MGLATAVACGADESAEEDRSEVEDNAFGGAEGSFAGRGEAGSGGARSGPDPESFGGSPSSAQGESPNPELPSGVGGSDQADPEPEGCEVALEQGPRVGLSLELKANSDEPDAPPRGELRIANRDDISYALSDLEIQYFVKSEVPVEAGGSVTVTVDYAQVNGRHYRAISGMVQGSWVELDPPIPSSDTVLRIGFTPASGLLQPGETALVRYRVHPLQAGQPSTLDQTNDYSFGACSLHAASWPKVLLLVNGRLSSGDPPEGFSDASEGSAGAGGQAYASEDAGSAGFGGGGGTSSAENAGETGDAGGADDSGGAGGAAGSLGPSDGNVGDPGWVAAGAGGMVEARSPSGAAAGYY